MSETVRVWTPDPELVRRRLHTLLQSECTASAQLLGQDLCLSLNRALLGMYEIGDISEPLTCEVEDLQAFVGQRKHFRITLRDSSGRFVELVRL